MLHVMKTQSRSEELSFVYTDEEERERDFTLALNLQQTLTEYPRQAWLLNSQEQQVVRKALHAFIAAHSDRMQEREADRKRTQQWLADLKQTATTPADTEEATPHAP